MSSGSVPLKVGSRIGHGGTAWIIESVEDDYRLLAREVGSGKREFLSIGSVTAAPVTEDDQAADETPAKDRKPKVGRWTETLKRRKIRALPISHPKKEKEKVAAELSETRQTTERFLILDAIARSKPGPSRREMIKDAAVRLGCSTATVYRHAKIVEIEGTPDALQRSTRADTGQFRLSANQLEITQELFKDKRFVDIPTPMPQVCEQINGRLRRIPGEKPISEGTLYKFERSLRSPRAKLLDEGRKEEVRNKYDSKAGSLPDADFPLAIVQMDHTPCQVVLVDQETRQPIGDPWLTIVTDCFSRMILAFVLSFEAPSAATVGLALYRTFVPKDDFLKKLGVPGSWPCWGFPVVMLVDNGAELNGQLMHAGRRKWRFDLRDRPAGKPKFGGHVETAFNTFMKQFATTHDGTKFSNPGARAEYDSDDKAIYTIEEYEKAFCDYVVNHYHLTEHTGKGMRKRAPIQRWDAGIFDGDVMAPIGLPDLPEDPEGLRIALLPVDYKVVNQGTVNIFSETYYSIELEELSALLPSYSDGDRGDRTHEIRYDPNDITFIWVYDAIKDRYIQAKVQNDNWKPKSLWQHRAERKAMGKPADEFADQRLARYERSDAQRKVSKKETKNARLEREKQRLREQGVIVKPKPPKKLPPPPPVDDAKRKAIMARAKPAK